jgi:8-oxo-dGTP pyrophosphatase MutT (NUDIX family)
MAVDRWKPSVTVAAVIEKDGRFLLVEEHTAEGLRLNNPAGHLEPAESPEQGCTREVLEETAHHFTPTALVGVYLSRYQSTASTGEVPATAQDITYLRFAFCGALGALEAGRPLDTGIVRTLWMTPDEVRQSAARHRSPLVCAAWKTTCEDSAMPLNCSTPTQVCSSSPHFCY